MEGSATSQGNGTNKSSVFESSITLRQLRFLRAVVEAGGFSAAARVLITTQPTVSYEIARLEQLAGAPLIERRGRSTLPTSEGEVLYGYAVRVLDAVDEAGEALRELRGIQRGRLVLGADITYGSYVLPGLLGAFNRKFPKVEFHLQIMNSTRLLAAVRDRSLELAIIANARESLGHDPEIVAHPFDPCTFVVAAPAGHPLAGQSRIARSALIGFPFVVGEPSSLPRRMFDELASSLTPPPRIALEATTGALKQAVISGLGLTILSNNGLAGERARGEIAVLDVEGFPIPGWYCAVHLRERRLSFATRAFVRFLMELTRLEQERSP